MPAITGASTGQGMGIQSGGSGNIWMQAGASAVGGVFDRLAQRIGVNYDNRKQLEQQKKLSELQLQNEERLMGIQNQKQLEFWKATSYPAQMQQLKLAGLNPGLLYGMGGAGGGTVGGGMPNAAAGTAENPHTHGQGMGIMNNALLLSQLKLMEEQRKNIEADTENKKVTTPKIQTETSNILQDTQNKQAQEIGQRIYNEIQQLKQKTETETQQDQSAQITALARQAEEQLQILQNQNAITTEQAVNARQTAAANLIALQLENDIKRKNLELTDEQIKKIQADVQNSTNMANLQLKINDLPQSVQTIIKTIGTILFMLK